MEVKAILMIAVTAIKQCIFTLGTLGSVAFLRLLTSFWIKKCLLYTEEILRMKVLVYLIIRTLCC